MLPHGVLWNERVREIDRRDKATMFRMKKGIVGDKNRIINKRLKLDYYQKRIEFYY